MTTSMKALLAAIKTAHHFQVIQRSGSGKIDETIDNAIDAYKRAAQLRAGNPAEVIVAAIDEKNVATPIPAIIQAQALDGAKSNVVQMKPGNSVTKERVRHLTGAELGVKQKPAKASKAPAKPAPAPKASKAAKAAPAPKAAPSKASEPKALGKRAQVEADARNGILPKAPDFSAETHTRFRGKLASVVALVEAKDIKGLKAFAINPISSSPKAIAKYRDLAVLALEAQAAKGKAA